MVQPGFADKNLPFTLVSFFEVRVREGGRDGRPMLEDLEGNLESCQWHWHRRMRWMSTLPRTRGGSDTMCRVADARFRAGSFQKQEVLGVNTQFQIIVYKGGAAFAYVFQGPRRRANP